MRMVQGLSFIIVLFMTAIAASSSDSNPNIITTKPETMIITPEIKAVLDGSRISTEHTSPNGTLFKLGIYQHYKGPYYQVVGACKNTETQEELVYYRCLYGDFGFWARPFSMFFEDVEYEGKIVPRFNFVQHIQET